MEVISGGFELGTLALPHPDPQVGFVGCFIFTEGCNSKLAFFTTVIEV
jgi:hypothetical protein